jgi:hypothetical protein
MELDPRTFTSMATPYLKREPSFSEGRSKRIRGSGNILSCPIVIRWKVFSKEDRS